MLARAGMGFFLLITMVVGLRLLLLAARTRALAECVIGVAYLGIGLGSVLVVVGGDVHATDPGRGLLLLRTGTVLTSVGAASLLIGCWRIFRPGEPIAAGVACFAIGGLGLSLASVLVVHGDVVPTRTTAYWIGFAIRVATFAWIGGESLRYRGLLRRRLALGLATATMAHRFLLWGIAASTTTVSYLVYLAFAARGSSPSASAAATAFLGALGATTGVCLWLAFLPPAAYRRWLEGRSAAAPAPEV